MNKIIIIAAILPLAYTYAQNDGPVISEITHGNNGLAQINVEHDNRRDEYKLFDIFIAPTVSALKDRLTSRETKVWATRGVLGKRGLTGHAEIPASTPAGFITIGERAQFVEPTTYRTPEDKFNSIAFFPPQYVWLDSVAGPVRMAWYETGPSDGETIVMMSGGLGWSYLFKEEAEVLAEEGYHVVLIDALGAGRSDKPAVVEPYYNKNFIPLTEAFIAEILGDIPYTIIGERTGATQALIIGNRNRSQVRRIVSSGPIFIHGGEAEDDNGLSQLDFYETFIKNNPYKIDARGILSQTNVSTSISEINQWALPFSSKAMTFGVYATFVDAVPRSLEHPDRNFMKGNWDGFSTLDTPTLVIDSSAWNPEGKEISEQIPGTNKYIEMEGFYPSTMNQASSGEHLKWIDLVVDWLEQNPLN